MKIVLLALVADGRPVLLVVAEIGLLTLVGDDLPVVSIVREIRRLTGIVDDRGQLLGERHH